MKAAPNILPCMREWFDRHVGQAAIMRPERRAPKHAPPAKPEPVVRTPCTDDDLQAIKAIAPLRYPVGARVKQFARNLQGAQMLSERQRIYLWSTVYRYRRQIHDSRLVATARRLSIALTYGSQA